MEPAAADRKQYQSKEAAAARSGWRGTDQEEEDASSRLAGREEKLLKLEPTFVSPCCTFDPEAAKNGFEGLAELRTELRFNFYPGTAPGVGSTDLLSIPRLTLTVYYDIHYAVY